MRNILIPALSILLIATAAHASSDDAWDEFRENVEMKCLEVAGENFKEPSIVVDPFGSESFGLAVVSGESKWSEKRFAMACVYDKKTKEVEIGGELPIEVKAVAPEEGD